MQQQVMFTACPRAIGTRSLILSVVISPKLDPQSDPQRLDTFPDFLDWPANSIHWRVSVGGADPIDATVISDPPDSTLWTGLFSDDTLVRRHHYPDYTNHLWWSYPTGNVVDFIHNLYQSVAINHPDEFPPVEILDEGRLEHLRQLYEDGRDKRLELRRLLLDKMREHKALPPESPAPELDFFQVWNFHQPGTLTAVPTPPTFDFHEVVSLCGEHFGLLRRLGLVVDLEVTGLFPTGNTTVRVDPEWMPAIGGASTNIRPTTNAVITDDLFLPRPADPGEIVNGRLPLAGDRYRVVQMDPDGGALNLIMLARNLTQSKMFASVDTPKEEALPALHGGGISVVRTGHALQLAQHVANGLQLNTQLQGGNPLTFGAEQLWYGTRFDVWDEVTTRWHSLQMRRGSYVFSELDHTEVIEEEGAMIEVPTERDDESDNPADDKFLYLQESLMRWDGWSLAAPRPGRTLDEQDDVIPEPESSSAGYPLQMRFNAVPGTLPRLRFGRRYRVRARTVDPAGNSVPFDGDAAHSTEIQYRRYEPIPTPFVLLTDRRTEGESDAHVVLRSDYNEDPAPSRVERILAPPRCAQRTAEYHGMWDNNWGNPSATYAEIVAREARGFHEEGFGTPDPDNYDQPYFPQKPVPIHYLPDPMARGASLRFIPRTGPEHDVLQSFEEGGSWPGGWPNARPLRLIVAEGMGAPDVQETPGEVEVIYRLPKAERVRVRVSSYPVDSDLDLSAIWELLENSGAPVAQIAQWRDLAAKGRHWMISPYRTMTLVHAVRRPLKPAAFMDGALAIGGRQVGDTFVRLGGLMSFSRKSTGRVDLHASWQEPVDLGAGGGVDAPIPLLGETMRAHQEWLEVPLAELTGSVDDVEDMLPITDLRQEFNDTKRRIVTYTARATSAFSEYFQLRMKDVPVVPGEVVTLDQVPVVEGSEQVTGSDDGPSFDRGVDYEMDYTTGELTWQGQPTTLEIVYLPEPNARMSTDAENEAEQQVVIDIPSSSRPQTPKVLYAIPTHRWQSFALGSTGLGGGLRIYLDRPFYETGVGQLLGVVLDPQFNTPSAALAAYTTRWGFDPIQGPPAPPTTTPRPQDFPLAAEGGIGMGRTLAETGGQVNVVGHRVDFDPDRKLWFCDIEVDAGNAHWPFIRLALASYQPNSDSGQHLSPVVLADIVQLTPDRTATLQLGGGSGGSGGGFVVLNVAGPGPTPGAAEVFATEITAHLEYRIGGVADEALGWEPLSPATPGRIALTPERESNRTVWKGELSLPESRISQNGDLRVVIEEWQILPESGDEGNEGAIFIPSLLRDTTEPAVAPGHVYRGQQSRSRRRLLYRDYIPLESPA